MAASNYPACIKKTLGYEGGYVNHPADPGGATNYGITIQVARENWKRDCTPDELRRIPMDVVHRIYKQKYWDKVMGDKLFPGVDLAVFDFGVNSGPARSNRYLATIKKGTDAVNLVKQLCAKRLAMYRGLRTWAVFGKGWGRRIADVEATGVKMALAALGNSSADVTKRLQKEAKEASDKTKSDIKKSAGTATGGAAGGAAAPTVTPAVDTSWIDTALTVLPYAAVATLVGIAIYFGIRAYNNLHRAEAYSAASGYVLYPAKPPKTGGGRTDATYEGQ